MFGSNAQTAIERLFRTSVNLRSGAEGNFFEAEQFWSWTTSVGPKTLAEYKWNEYQSEKFGVFKS